MPAKRKQHELLPFLAIWAEQYRRDYGLNGIHPNHYALMEKYGAPMERFPIATNAPDVKSPQTTAQKSETAG